MSKVYLVIGYFNNHWEEYECYLSWKKIMKAFDKLDKAESFISDIKVLMHLAAEEIDFEGVDDNGEYVVKYEYEKVLNKESKLLYYKIGPKEPEYDESGGHIVSWSDADLDGCDAYDVSFSIKEMEVE